MNNLYLIGTSHIDPDGTYRLDSLLRDLSPKKIFIEISQDRADVFFSKSTDDWKKEHEDTIKEWERQGFVLTNEQRSKLLELVHLKNRSHGFEVICPAAYKQRNSETDIYYVDIVGDDIKEGLAEAFGESQEPTPEVRAKVISGLQSSIEDHLADLRKIVDFQYKNAHKLASYSDAINNDLNFIEREFGMLSDKAKESLRRVFDQKRNELIAREIRTYHNDKDVSVAIMGATHMDMVGYLLSDLKPQYILLNQVPVPTCKQFFEM